MRKDNQNFYGFTVRNWKAEFAGFPIEDNYAYDENRKIAVVADGVTRDFLDGSVVTKNLGGLLKSWKGKYPKYAQDVSRLCTETFLKTNSLVKVNKAIEDYNSKTFKEINYLANDFAGCTSAGIFEKDGFLEWQFICDSGITILDQNGNLKFKTPSEGPNSIRSIDEEVRRLYNSGFNESKGRRIIRSQYRNNPEEPLAYGVLTGEKNALSYIRTGKEKLKDGDYVLVYTDGIKDIIFKDEDNINQDVLVSLWHGKSEMKKFCNKRISTEGTLVVYRKPTEYYATSFLGSKNRIRMEEDFFGPLGPNGTYLGR
jgi:hypothetical protein